MDIFTGRLVHSGVGHDDNPPGRGSGRYEWGEGDHAYQRDEGFMGTYMKYLRMRDEKGQPLKEIDIAKAMGYRSTAEFRKARSLAKDEEKAATKSKVYKLLNEGKSITEIAKEVGKTEGDVRYIIKTDYGNREQATGKLKDKLIDIVNEKGYIDVGPGVAQELGVSDTRLKTAIASMKLDGYSITTIRIPQQTNKLKNTTFSILGPKDTGMTEDEIRNYLYHNQEVIQPVGDYLKDENGQVMRFQYPQSIDISRVKVVYGDQGGIDKDGVIELRRGVDDLSLGNSSYAQVRIAVNGSHFMKGMALYSDNVPDGYDVVYYTNKPTGTPILPTKEEQKENRYVMKMLKDDPQNPFGAALREEGGQYTYLDKTTGEEKLGAINKLSQEGDWDEWSRTVSSQMLSKQPYSLVKSQLEKTYEEKLKQFEEIKSVTQPIIRQQLLEDFASDCETAAEDLKATSFPRQAPKVILPLSTISDKEVYAPSFLDGEEVVLIRYPHAGQFEIPRLKVNNKLKEGIDVLGNTRDAIGISSETASILSGADFDGDTAMVIPVNNKVKISTMDRDLMPGLKDFEPVREYPGYPGMNHLNKANTQKEMGKVSNLITDMTIRGAPPEDIVKAVKHSMVIIDADKHNLDWKRSEADQEIAELKKKYQVDPVTGKAGGASTLISRSRSTMYAPEREELLGLRADKIDPETGKLLINETGRIRNVVKSISVKDENGRIVKDDKGNPVKKKVFTGDTEVATRKYTKMSLTDDARTLSTGTAVEEEYAKYANRMKAMANDARKEWLATPTYHVDPEAKKTYASEVNSIMAKLNKAVANSPRERMAQISCNIRMYNKKRDNPELKQDKKELKKQTAKELSLARNRFGAKKERIELTSREWEAIMARTLGASTIRKIYSNSREGTIQSYAVPKKNKDKLTSAKTARIKAMRASGKTTGQIAQAVGLSTTTISKVLSGELTA